MTDDPEPTRVQTDYDRATAFVAKLPPFDVGDHVDENANELLRADVHGLLRAMAEEIREDERRRVARAIESMPNSGNIGLILKGFADFVFDRK